jgi:hypothetical protein
VQGAFSQGVKRPAREAEDSSPTSAEVDLYVHFFIRFHSVLLSKLSTGTTFLFTFNIFIDF